MRLRCLVVALTLLAAFASDSWGQSQEPPKIHQVQVEQQPDRARKSDAEAEAEINKSAELARAIYSFLPRNLDEKANNSPDLAYAEASEYWTIFGRRLKITDTLLALFTFILIVVGAWQGIQLKNTVDLSRAEFISSHRPRLRIRSVDRSTSNPTDFIGVKFAVVNVGDTEARLLGSRVVVDFFPEKPPIDLNGTDVVEPRRFLPGASDSYVVTSSRKWLPLQSEYNAARYLFVHGQVVYRNDLGTTYTTSFCRIWNVAANRFKRTDDPDYEYED